MPTVSRMRKIWATFVHHV